MNVVEASMKISDQVRSLDHLYPGIQVDKQKVHIHPSHLFYRLTAILASCLMAGYKQGPSIKDHEH